MKTQTNTDGKTSQEKRMMVARITILEEQVREIGSVLEREILRNQESDERIAKILSEHSKALSLLINKEVQ